MLVKCGICEKKIDREVAFKVSTGKSNKYYCSENEYNAEKAKRVQEKTIRENTYKKIFECFGREITNTILFKEINELQRIYGFKKILAYLDENLQFLTDIMSKRDFVSEYAKIRYFTAILKNNLGDFIFSEQIKKDRVIEQDMPEIKFKPRKARRGFAEIESEMEGDK